jgi:hypothetical protein
MIAPAFLRDKGLVPTELVAAQHILVGERLHALFKVVGLAVLPSGFWHDVPSAVQL